MTGFPSLAGAKPSRGFDLIEPGKYLVAITDYKFLSNAEGWEGVRFEFTVQSGAFKNRKVWKMYTTHHPKDEVRQRGLDELAGVLTAAGHPNPASPDSAPIKGLQLGIAITKVKNRQTKEEENGVRTWFPKEELAADAPIINGAAGPAALSLSLASLGAEAQQGEAKTALNDEIPF
jgi:hypothetical protein